MIKDLIQGKTKLLKPRSKEWYKFRNEIINKVGSCSICGSLNKLELHHIKPFHLYPELELDPQNCIVICESKDFIVNCHLIFGHLGDYRNENKALLSSIEMYQEMVESIKTYLPPK